jgi:hypothetical protein
MICDQNLIAFGDQKITMTDAISGRTCPLQDCALVVMVFILWLPFKLTLCIKIEVVEVVEIVKVVVQVLVVQIDVSKQPMAVVLWLVYRDIVQSCIHELVLVDEPIVVAIQRVERVRDGVQVLLVPVQSEIVVQTVVLREVDLAIMVLVECLEDVVEGEVHGFSQLVAIAVLQAVEEDFVGGCVAVEVWLEVGVEIQVEVVPEAVSLGVIKFGMVGQVGGKVLKVEGGNHPIIVAVKTVEQVVQSRLPGIVEGIVECHVVGVEPGIVERLVVESVESLRHFLYFGLDYRQEADGSVFSQPLHYQIF